MKAIVYTKYGPPEVLELRDVARPEPGADQVLVRVRAASVNALDYRRFESLSAFGRVMTEKVLKAVSQVLGADIAGTVEAVGATVRGIKPGDEVFGVSAGLVGGFAEYACAREDHVVLKPASLSFDEAAAVPMAALTALRALRGKVQIRPGQKVLIHGASGGVGTFAVQMAKSFGAEVTAVCSTRNLDRARSIGADHVIDYTKEDFCRGANRYDLIVAVNGYHSILAYRRALRPGGRYVAVGGTLGQIFQAMLLGPLVSVFGSRKLRFMGITKANQADLLVIRELLETGKIAPVVDRRYPLAEAPAAFRYLVSEHAGGKVVLTVGGHPGTGSPD